MDQSNNSTDTNPLLNTPTLDVQLKIITPTFLIILLVLFLLHRFRPLSTVLFPKEDGKWHYSQPDFFSWITSTWNSTNEDIFHHAGPDGLILFVFLEMILKFFFFATLVCFIFILPIHVTYESARGFQSIYTIAVIDPNSNVFFAHLVVAWVLVIAFYFFFYKAYRQVVSIQKSYVLRPTIAARTILVSGINPKGREEDLKDYFNSLRLGEVEHVTIVHRSKKLTESLEERWKWIEKMEAMVAKDPEILTPLLKKWLESNQAYLNPSFSVDKVAGTSFSSNNPTHLSSQDSILNSKQKQASSLTYGSEERGTTMLATSISPPPPPFWKFWSHMSSEQRLNYFFKMFVLADGKVQEYRAHYSQLSSPLPVAMVTFKHPASSTLATQCVLHSDILKFDIQRAPEPQDLNFPNLGLSPFELIYRRYLHMVGLIGLIALWTFPVAAMNALFNLEKLGKYLPDVKNFITSNKILSDLASSIFPTLGLTIFMALLPMILNIFSSFRRFASMSRIALSVFSSYFLFQFFLVFLAFSLSGPLYELKTIKDNLNFDYVTQLLATSLPDASMFFLNYILLHIGSVLPLGLIPIGGMVMYLLFPPRTPRQNCVVRARTLFSPSDLTFSVMIWIIGFVYTTICPVMLLPCLIYTAFVWFFWRYRLLYQLSMVDSRGQLFVHLCHMWTVAPFFFILLMIGMLSLKQFPFSAFLFPLLLFHIGAFFWTSKAFRKLTTIPLDLWRVELPTPPLHSSSISIGTIKVHRVPFPNFQGQTGIDGLPLSFGQTDVQGSLPNVWFPSHSYQFGVEHPSNTPLHAV